MDFENADAQRRFFHVVINCCRTAEHELLKGMNADIHLLELAISSLQDLWDMFPANKTLQLTLINLMNLINVETAAIQVAADPGNPELQCKLQLFKNILGENNEFWLKAYIRECECYDIGTLQRNTWIKYFCRCHMVELDNSWPSPKPEPPSDMMDFSA